MEGMADPERYRCDRPCGHKGSSAIYFMTLWLAPEITLPVDPE